jgi:hypothetical protein
MYADRLSAPPFRSTARQLDCQHAHRPNKSVQRLLEDYAMYRRLFHLGVLVFALSAFLLFTGNPIAASLRVAALKKTGPKYGDGMDRWVVDCEMQNGQPIFVGSPAEVYTVGETDTKIAIATTAVTNTLRGETNTLRGELMNTKADILKAIGDVMQKSLEDQRLKALKAALREELKDELKKEILAELKTDKAFRDQLLAELQKGNK